MCPLYITMEAGGLIAEVGWTEFDFLSHGEESEVMAQLLGAFPSHGEEGHHELPWSDQASNAYSEAALLSHLHMRATVSVTQMKL